MDVPVGPPVVSLHVDDEFVVSAPDATITATEEQGYFASDTRFVSGYSLRLGGVRPLLLNSSEVESHSARFEFTNAVFPTGHGLVDEQTVQLRLDRTVGGGVHEDYELVNYGRGSLDLALEVTVESDFADVFDVKRGHLVRRGVTRSEWDEDGAALTTRYCNDSFRRQVVVRVDGWPGPVTFANGTLCLRAKLAPGERWKNCLYWMPVGEDGRRSVPARACHDLLGAHDHDVTRRRWVAQVTRFDTSDPEVNATVGQAIEDLASLRLRDHDAAAPGHDADGDWVPAAGVPWFVALFGRDTLMTSLQSLALSPTIALGTLRVLGALQGDGYDDERDMQPGKIHHELRRGELATLGLVPHRPYYGTHEASSLYVWSAAESWRWHGDRGALNAVRPHVERCLRWIDRDGDPDGDGLQEYATRAAAGGYFNQGWKDSGLAIVDHEGRVPRTPIALCEHQGYVVAAKRAWADTLEQAYGDQTGTRRLREEANRLAGALEDRFWWEEEGTYVLGLDGDKRRLESVTSNPGHLLWARAVEPARAESVARRLLAADMWSGWGIRTLSAGHVAYNPFSYQLGSVWPHDNAVCAAGFRAYGLDDEAAQVARGILDASALFRSRRPPELFAGLERDPGGFPVQYPGANVPQAWASGAVVHLLTTLLGLEADASSQRLSVNPALPDWLPEVRVERIAVGSAVADLRVGRDAAGAHSVEWHVRRGSLDVAG